MRAKAMMCEGVGTRRHKVLILCYYHDAKTLKRYCAEVLEHEVTKF